MNIDKRLEAIAHSVELLAAMQLDTEKRQEKRLEETDKRLHILIDNVNRIAIATQDHENRIRRLEGD